MKTEENCNNIARFESGAGSDFETAGSGLTLIGFNALTAIKTVLSIFILTVLICLMTACSEDGVQSGEIIITSAVPVENDSGILDKWCGEFNSADYSSGESEGMPLTVYKISDDEGEYLRFSFGVGEDYYAFTFTPVSNTFYEVIGGVALTFTLDSSDTVTVKSEEGGFSVYAGVYHTESYWTSTPELDPEKAEISESWLGEYVVYDENGTPIKWLTVSDALDTFAPYKLDMTFSGGETLFMLSQTPSGNNIEADVDSIKVTLTMTEEGINVISVNGEGQIDGFYERKK